MSRAGLRGRPLVQTDYAQDIALVNTPAKRRAFWVILALALAGPFILTDSTLSLLAIAFVAAVGAIGLNLVTGYAGQISLGHGFFLGVGAFTAAVVAGNPDNPNLIGFGYTSVFIWLPAAGLVAAAFGLLIGPLAVRLRGLYLAIVTLGLVFIGDHYFRHTSEITGGSAGRSMPQIEIGTLNFSLGGDFFGVELTREQAQFYFAVFFLLVFAILARNIARSGVGRAFSAVRDRDVAAAVVGVDLTKYKMLAFTLSSFYAGICGAVMYSFISTVSPDGIGDFDLMHSIQFLAIVLIGGIATISGTIAGAVFIISLERTSAQIAQYVPFVGDGGLLSLAHFEGVIYGLLIIGFLVFEPRGLFGIWMRIRNYWKGWPFSY